MQSRKHVWIVLFLAVLATGSVVAQGPGGAMPPPEVTVVSVENKTIPIEYEYIGVVEASKTVEVRARVQGFLDTRDFEEGAYVTQGTRLFTIDPRSFKADLQIAQAQVEQAQTRLKLADQDVKRLQSVREPGSIAQADLDQKLAEQSNAAAALRLAKAQLAKTELDLSYTEVQAPLTGFVDKANKEIGSFVDSGQNSLLTLMRQVDPIYVSFKVSEKDFLSMRQDTDKGIIVLAAGNTEPYVEIVTLDGNTYDNRGKLNFENAAVDTQTGTVELRATFENAAKRLKPGQFVKVHMKGWERPNTLVVPQRAVSQSPKGSFVYVVGEDMKTQFRIITTGPWAGKEWAVLSGLEAGEQVVQEGLMKVRPGIVVSIKPAGDPAAPAAAPAPAAPGQ